MSKYHTTFFKTVGVLGLAFAVSMTPAATFAQGTGETDLRQFTGDLTDLVYIEGQPVLSVRSGTFQDERRLLDRLAYSMLSREDLWDQIDFNPLSFLGPDEIRQGLVEVFGDIPQRYASYIGMMEATDDAARQNGIRNAMSAELSVLNEFEQQRLRSTWTQLAETRLAEEAIEGPIDVFMICANVEAYDFGSEAFAVDEGDFERFCTNTFFQPLSLPVRPKFEIDTGRTPSSISLAPSEAEALRRQAGNDVLRVGFPARIHVRFEPGVQPVMLYEGQRTGPYIVVASQQLGTVLHEIEEDGLPLTNAERIQVWLDDFARPWRLGFNEERTRIAELATNIDFDAISTIQPGLSDNPQSFTFRMAVPTVTDAANLQELGQFSGQEIFGGRLAQRIAERIGQPTAHVGLVNLVQRRPEHPTRHVVLVLPQAAENYLVPTDVPPPPSNPSQEFRSVDFEVSEAFLVPVPPRSGLPVVGDVLFLIANPSDLVAVEGGRAYAMMEAEPERWRVALNVAPETQVEIAQPQSITLALPSDFVHAAAQEAGVSTADVLLPMFSRNFLDGNVFAQQEAAQALAEHAAQRPYTGNLILTTTLTLRDYDLQAEGWRWSWRGLRFPNGLAAEEAAIYINPQAPLEPSGERLGLYLPMPLEEARRLSEASAHPEYLARVHIRMEPVEFENSGRPILQYRVFEIELLEPTANPAIGNASARVARILLDVPDVEPVTEVVPEPEIVEPVVQEPEVAMPTVPAPEVADANPDVLGITIGMPIEEAQQIINDHMDIGWTLVADRRRLMGANIGTPFAWSSGRMFVNRANREFIALYFEPDAPNFGVLGIVRWVFVQPESVDGARLGPALMQRYGEPFEAREVQESTSTGFLWTWTTPNTQPSCGFVALRPQMDIWTLENPDAPFRAPFGIYDLALPDLRTRPNVSTYLAREDLLPTWLCPRTLSVRTWSVRPSFGLPDDQSHAIVSVLYDEQRAINTLRAAEAVRAATPAPTGGANANFEIDF